ncbi:hypothetical protein SAMN04515695_0192 [Pseudovibrio sp. Tun.PSC04-5.I4]|nr:hypothetical protein SAMN04515695_0192 [Pseudovibrio sp. Tun.PSC04-5.I4]
MGPLFNFRHDLAFCGTIRTEFVGDDPFGRHALLLQKTGQQSLGSLGITSFLKDFIEYVVVLIDGTPEIIAFALDLDHNLVQLPDISRTGLLSP